MRSRHLFKLTLLGALLGVAPLQAASPDDETAVAPPRSTVDRPEYLPSRLPDDVFKPSKEISDDYPIDLPVDI